jgi:hypothetical protein
MTRDRANDLVPVQRLTGEIPLLPGQPSSLDDANQE